MNKRYSDGDLVHDASNDPIENLALAVIQSYVVDIRKALRRHNKQEALRLLEEMPQSPFARVLSIPIEERIIRELRKEIEKC